MPHFQMTVAYLNPKLGRLFVGEAGRHGGGAQGPQAESRREQETEASRNAVLGGANRSCFMATAQMYHLVNWLKTKHGATRRSL
jgi:hypothetical protein